MILTLKDSLDRKVDMTPITPSLCAEKNTKELEKFTLQTSKGVCKVADLFTLSTETSERLVIRNTNAMLNNLGAKLESGELIVEGDAGNWLAHQMSGGHLIVTGSVGDYAAGAMSAGRLDINGNAGNNLGGAQAGSHYGINGGTVIVQGNVGNYLGDRMRNGLLVIKGNTGDYCAARMVAGTIFVGQEPGAYPGFNMRRGSLFLSRSRMNEPPAFFTTPRYHEISFLPLFIKFLQKVDPDLKWPVSRYAYRCLGDRSISGLGEIFLI